MISLLYEGLHLAIGLPGENLSGLPLVEAPRGAAETGSLCTEVDNAQRGTAPTHLSCTSAHTKTLLKSADLVSPSQSTAI
jgi:hypothetical protein